MSREKVKMPNRVKTYEEYIEGYKQWKKLKFEDQVLKK